MSKGRLEAFSDGVPAAASGYAARTHRIVHRPYHVCDCCRNVTDP